MANLKWRIDSVLKTVHWASAALYCSAAFGQISLVNVTPCGEQSFPSACTVPATGSGHLIAVGWKSIGNTGTGTVITSITDDAGNIYHEAGEARSIDTIHNAILDIWYARNSKAGATSLTITTNPPAVRGGAVIWEFAGVDTASPLNQTAVVNNQAASSTPQGAAAVASSPNQLILSAVNSQNATRGILSGNPFTNDATVGGASWAHLVTPAAGTYTAKWNQSASGTYSASTAVFNPAAAVSACDLNADLSVDVLDVQLGTDMDLGLITPCTAPGGLCNPVFVQNVLNAALGQACSLTVLGVNPAQVSFGNVVVGATATQSASLTATGSGSTTISQIAAAPAAFTVSGVTLPATLAAGGSLTFNLGFTPAAAGAATGNLTIATSSTSAALNAPVSVPLSGSGVTALPHSVSVKWTASTTANVAAYNVYRIASSSSVAPALPYPLLAGSLAATGICTGTANTCSYTDSAVTAGSSYWYYAVAVDSSNNLSGPSNTAQAVVPTP